MRRVPEVDERLWVALRDLISRPDVLEQALALRASRSAQDGQGWESEAQAAKRALSASVARERAVLDRWRRGLISQAGLDAALEGYARERTMLERQLATARKAGAAAGREGADVAQLAATVRQLRARVAVAGPVERQALVRALVPGEGDQVVTIGQRSVEALVTLAPSPAAGLVSGGFYSNSIRDCVSIRLVA